MKSFANKNKESIRICCFGSRIDVLGLPFSAKNFNEVRRIFEYCHSHYGKSAPPIYLYYSLFSN